MRNLRALHLHSSMRIFLLAEPLNSLILILKTHKKRQNDTKPIFDMLISQEAVNIT